jgi:NADH:ubiquinone oxidoreductase subunit 4 (subunit M)
MNILCIPVFLPLIVGFVLLFLPNKMKSVSRALALIISVIAVVLAVRIFISGESGYTWSILQIDDLKLDLLLSVTPLGG